MAEVIKLSERKAIMPKHVEHRHMNQRYTCTFDPNASPDKQWVWAVHFTRTYKFYGATATMDSAQSRAVAQIKKMTDRTITAEEDSA